MKRLQCGSVAVIVGLLGCTNGQSKQDRDLLAQEAPLWTSCEHPVATVGGHIEHEGHALSSVRGGLLLPGGEIAVADGGSGEIRLFTNSGAYRRSLGRRGGGPGEFAVLSRIGHGPSKSVCGWDARLGRLTCFNGDGEIQMEVNPDFSVAQQMVPRFLGVFEDGSSVFEDSRPDRDMREESSGERRDTLRYLRFAADGAAAGVLATAPGSETFFLNEDGVWGQEPVLFGRGTIAYLDGTRLLLGTNDSLDLRVIDPSGSTIGHIARPTSLRRVDTALIERVRAELLHDLEAQEALRASTISMPAADMKRLARVQRDHIRRRPYRSTMPAFTELRIDHEGLIWIAEPDHPDSSSERTWRVIDDRGTLLGQLKLPAAASVLDISGERILLLARDEMDVESVLLCRVEGYTNGRRAR